MPSIANLGTLWANPYNNILWNQPGGPGTAVFPAQQRNQPFTAYPVGGQVIDEVGEALWHPGCGHGIMVWRVQKDFDPTTGQNCALVLCSVCSWIDNVIEPFEDAVISIAMPNKYPIIVS